MTARTVRARVAIGQVDDYDREIEIPQQPESIKLRATQFEAPTLRANLVWRVPIVEDVTKLLPSSVLHWLSIDMTDGLGVSRRFNMWIRELKEVTTADDYSLEIEAVSADYFLTIQQIREDIAENQQEIPSQSETLGQFWERIFRLGGIVAGTPSGYSYIRLVSDMDYTSPGSPTNTPRIPVDPGATLWDSAYLIAQHWRAYVDGSKQEERDTPTVTLTPWAALDGYGRDFRTRQGTVLEIHRESNFDNWGERIRNTRRWWEISGGELVEMERVTYYGQGGTLGKTLDVATIGNLEPSEAMEARAARVRNRVTRESIVIPLDLDLDLGVGVWIDATGDGHLDRRITGITHDIDTGLTTLELEPSDTPVYITPWINIPADKTWATIYLMTWHDFDAFY